MEQRNLIVGYDFNNDVTAISCINPKSSQLESICVGKKEGYDIIPTVIGITRDSKEWVYGNEALELEKENRAMLVKNIITALEKGEDISLYETRYSPEILLEKFLRKTLLLLKSYYPNQTIDKIVISVHKLNNSICKSIYSGLKKLGIDEDRAMVHTHDESYVSYALNQEKELWNNNIGVFYFNQEGLYYSQLNVVPYQIVAAKAEKKYSYLATSKEIDYTASLSYTMIKTESKDRLLSIFMNIAKSVLHRQVVSTLYVTGVGFKGDWVNEGLMELCNGRRVFKGDNLHSRGATYLAKEYTEYKSLKEFYIIGKDMIKQSLSLVAYKYGSIQDIILLDGNKKWYEVDECLHVILDDADELTFKLKDISRKDETIIKLLLHGLPPRPNKSTRIQIQLQSFTRESIVIKAKDLGFGKWNPATHRVWETEIKF